MLRRIRVRPSALVVAAILGVLAWPAAGHTEQLLAAWQAVVVTTGPDGGLLRTRETGDALVTACGEEQLPPIPRARLDLVYDTSTDALEVVRVRDGSVVCAPFRFVAAVLVGSLSGGGVRQALVVDGADGRAVGAVVGPFTTPPRTDGTPGATVWKAKLSGSQRESEDGRRRIVEGVFRTGAPFRPRPTGTAASGT